MKRNGMEWRLTFALNFSIISIAAVIWWGSIKEGVPDGIDKPRNFCLPAKISGDRERQRRSERERERERAVSKFVVFFFGQLGTGF